MDMRLFTVTLAGLTACALGACTVESSGSTSTTTASTSTSASTTVGSGGAGGAGSAATGVGGSGGSGGDNTACDPAYTCAEAITPSTGNPALLCDGDAKVLYTALSSCTCTGACAAACKESACQNDEPSTTCKMCLSNSTTGCGKDFKACTSGG